MATRHKKKNFFFAFFGKRIDFFYHRAFPTINYFFGSIGVARWYISKPKIQIWVKFGRPCNGRCWYFYGHFVYFLAEWYILGQFGTFFPILVCCTEKNLATLGSMASRGQRSSICNVYTDVHG
jgi:hypothetical protein